MSKLLFILFLVSASHCSEKARKLPPDENQENLDQSVEASYAPDYSFLTSYLSSIKYRVDYAVSKFQDVHRVASFQIDQYEKALWGLENQFQKMIQKNMLISSPDSANRTLCETLSAYEQIRNTTNHPNRVADMVNKLNVLFVAAKQIKTCYYAWERNFYNSAESFKKTVDIRNKALENLYEDSEYVCSKKPTVGLVIACLREKEEIVDNFIVSLPELETVLRSEVKSLTDSVDTIKTCASGVDYTWINHVRRTVEQDVRFRLDGINQSDSRHSRSTDEEDWGDKYMHVSELSLYCKRIGEMEVSEFLDFRKDEARQLLTMA